MSNLMVFNKKLNNQKVVFKYPIKNDACFIFISSYELMSLIRKATKIEEVVSEFVTLKKRGWLEEFRVKNNFK